MIRLRSTMLLVSLALLAACHGSNQKDDRRSASGEVLPGSVSDGMLPLDKLKSQGPTQAPSAGKGAAGSAADETSGTTDATSATSETPPDQASPSPSPSPSSPARGGGNPQG